MASLRETVADARAPVLIDQEGGRVTRLAPPNWRERPCAARFGEVYANAQEAATEAATLSPETIYVKPAPTPAIVKVTRTAPPAPPAIPAPTTRRRHHSDDGGGDR